MTNILIVLSILTFGTGIRAAQLWHKASKVNVMPMWENAGQMEPVDPSQSSAAWILALMQTAQKSGALNKRAALWTAASVLLGTAASIMSTLASATG